MTTTPFLLGVEANRPENDKCPKLLFKKGPRLISFLAKWLRVIDASSTLSLSLSPNLQSESTDSNQTFTFFGLIIKNINDKVILLELFFFQVIVRYKCRKGFTSLWVFISVYEVTYWKYINNLIRAKVQGLLFRNAAAIPLYKYRVFQKTKVIFLG